MSDKVKKLEDTFNDLLGGDSGKGSAVLRINMGFTEDNQEYLKEESRKRGLSITGFVNAILTEYRESPYGYIFGK